MAPVDVFVTTKIVNQMNPEKQNHSEEKLVEWFSLRLTRKQLFHIEILCRFHLQLSDNEKAKKLTKKLQWCLKHWVIYQNES